MKSWNNYLLKSKMFIVFSAVSLFIVMLTCIIFYYKNVSDIKNQTLSLSDTITRQFSRTFELYMQDVEKLSVSIIGDPIIQQSLIDHYRVTDSVAQNEIELTINKRLFTHLQPRPQLQSIYIFTTDDIAYFVSKGGGPKVSFKLREENWYEKRLEMPGIKFLLQPVTTESTGGEHEAKVISFVRNINRIPYRDVLAYMKININVNVFKDMLVNSDSNEIERNMRAFIITDEGSVIYDDRNELTGSEDSGIDLSIFQGSGQSGELIWNGENYLYTMSKSSYTKWNTLILIPSEFLLKKQQHTAYILILVGLLAMGLIAFVSYTLSYQITLPLRNLMKKMARVEQGDLSQRMEVAGNNEFSRLSRIYNRMLDSITRLIGEVYTSKLAEKNAQISALQAQINPHFLYNTLNIMKSISRVRGIEEVAEMAESLAELFKYSMKNLQRPIPLRDEMDHISHYMNIQQHRFGSRFEFSMDVPEALQDASILKLTVQPLIENAIVHGLGKVKSGGRIVIAVRRLGDDLIIEVSDNGCGIEEERLHMLRKRIMGIQAADVLEEDGLGIGLSNIALRIKLFHGVKYGAELISANGRGTTVRLTFPYERFVKVKGEAG
ncbi:cache domain-containing sensor histidine kinase [Paenibacillus glycanilyticus]|uniref:histidine kinase n=1 Tax=Paenibacillus glycanilyticus TaxID=126569 RepID=A0ABQ6GJE3_9BACL|nr:sensor histidine kinase [Paenibacillus glycanilyticus]GLX70827.1 histidine kinase [Paenibacillus glycanilyticus]